MTCTTAPNSRLPLAALALTFVGLACGGDDPTGAISVRYALGATNMCEGLDIQRVRVNVGDGTESAEQDCDPNQPIVIDSINAGNYPLLVTAIDGAGITVMDNLGAPEDDDTVEVVGGSSREVDAMLSATPASIGVKWFNSLDGEPAECQFVVTKTFQVIAYESNGNSQLLSHDFDCVKPPGFAIVPDPTREINGQDLDTIQVRLLDEDDSQLTSVTFEFDPPGPGRQVEITLNCNEVNGEVTCTGESSVGEGGGDTNEPTSGGDPTGGAGDSSSG